MYHAWVYMPTQAVSTLIARVVVHTKNEKLSTLFSSQK